MSTSEPEYATYDPKNMPFRRLGNTGLRVPLFSLGGWLSLGEKANGEPSGDAGRAIIKAAFERGINMFDTAEGYNAGASEVELGRAIKELRLRRTDLILSTKLYWGPGDGPNDSGLSRKHIVEGTRASLARLQTDYVDLLFAHRPDYSVPMEEIVRAFDWVIKQGWALYWGTSEWPAQQIEAAHHVATRLGLAAPVADQCLHHMFHRERPEQQYAPLYKNHGMGTTVYAALASGLLTGKYNDGIPPGSRFAVHGMYVPHGTRLASAAGRAQVAQVRQLAQFAEARLGCSVAQLALAWVAVDPNTSTVILGASAPGQVVDNLGALAVLPKLTPEVREEIEEILGNKPGALDTWGRPQLDPHGRA